MSHFPQSDNPWTTPIGAVCSILGGSLLGVVKDVGMAFLFGILGAAGAWTWKYLIEPKLTTWLKRIKDGKTNSNPPTDKL